MSLNDRDNRWARAKKIAEWKNAVIWLVRAQRIPACSRVTIQLMYTPRDDRVRDPLNLAASLKVCEDGIVAAGVIVDDSAAYHTSVMPQITPKGPARAGGNRLWLVVTPH